MHELACARELRAVLGTVQPHAVHPVGLKAIQLAAIATPQTIGMVCTYSGLGYLFTHNTLKTRLIRGVFATVVGTALSGRTNVVAQVQNFTDATLVQQSRLATPDQVAILHGAGVDTTRFTPGHAPANRRSS